MNRIQLIALMVFMICSLSQLVFGAIDIYEFKTEEQQQRFRNLSEEIRCPMCVSSSLAGSNALIATELKQEVFRMIMEGQSDEEIRNFMANRYGEFVLYRPRFSAATAILWIAPIALLLLGIFVITRLLKANKQSSSDVVLSANESERLRQILSSDSRE